MKYLQLITFSLFVCATSISCSEKKAPNDTPASIHSFDASSYQSKDLGDGLIRLWKTDDQGALLEEGYVQNGMKTGQWVTYAEGRIRHIESWLEGKKNGKFLDFEQRHQITKEATYVNDILDGRKAEYKFGRPKWEEYYSNGKLHGKVSKYFETGAETGKLSQTIDYVHGQIDGDVRYYNTNGEITVEYKYKDGKKIDGGMVE